MRIRSYKREELKNSKKSVLFCIKNMSFLKKKSMVLAIIKPRERRYYYVVIFLAKTEKLKSKRLLI